MIAESRILSSFSKPTLFVPTQLLTLQDAKVCCMVLRMKTSYYMITYVQEQGFPWVCSISMGL